MSFQNTIAIITGAGSGIGKATRHLLTARGCRVYNLDLAPPEGEPADFFLPCDVRDKHQIRAAIAEVAAREGRIDFLFANAGIHLFATMEETTDEQLENVVATNLFGPFYTVQAVLPHMKAQGKGSIVLMGSDQTFVGKASSSVYGLTKGAIGQLTKSTAIDCAPFGIRVNCICPGTINTPLIDKAVARFVELYGADPAQVYQDLDKVQPMGRLGKPEEIAASVAFLLSDESSFTTGSLLAVDGGYVCQ